MRLTSKAIGTPTTTANGPSTAVGLSPDGRFLVFESDATDLFPNTTNPAHSIFLQDRLLGSTELVSINESGASSPFTH